ncbi:site-specific integrase [Bacteriovoracaceae bacterium]|nr:site-specific integrase [Bacteriovoracaceae bacterium]
MNNQVAIHKLQGNFWQTSAIYPGSQKRVRARFSSYKDVKKNEKYLKTLLADGKNPNANRKIGDLLELHLQKCPETKVIERKNVFIMFCERFCKTKICDLNVYDLKKWFRDIQKARDYSDLTLNHIKGNLNHFFYYLVDEGIIMESPLSQIRFNRNPPPKKPRVYLTVNEIKELLDNAKEYSPLFLYPFLYCLAHTGARRSEVVGLRWKDVDFPRGVLTFIETKNGTNRTIKMSPQLTKLLQGQPRTSSYVFTNPKGEQVGRSQLNRHIYAFKAHYPFHKDWQCHAFRHSFAYNNLKGGMNMYELQALLGHKSIQLTIDLYGQLLSEDVEKPSPYNF